MGQTTTIIDSTDPFHKRVIAGAEYKKGSLHRWLWGTDYRKEWSTPVTVPILDLDSAFGGLTVVKDGGSRQTRTLRLKDTSGRQYVLRSVNKTYLGALPEIVQGTFVENLANDQIATLHPYAALTVPQMAEAAGVYHTHPRYFIIPYHQRLEGFNRDFANTLCLLEERPDSSQISQPDFGMPEDIVNSDRMEEMLLKENKYLMDQNAYVKARLFDMFIGDWGRNEDNWRWARFDSGTYKVYRPIPRDRDQAYALFEGSLLSLIISFGKFRELQSFDDKIKSIKWYNYTAYALDRRLTNALSLQAWIDTAKAIQHHLTDSVIEKAVLQMPPEIFALSGETIIRKLKSRRDHLVEDARKYYAFLSRDVEIPGTRENELFEVERLNDQQTAVRVYRITRQKEKDLIYARTFLNKETKEIRLYGVGGQDVFRVQGNVQKGIKIRVIGGTGRDSLIDNSYVGGWGHQTKFYDNPGNYISTSPETKVHVSKFYSINEYDYETFKYNSRGVKPTLYFNDYYQFYIGLGYGFTKNKTRKGGFTTRHNIGLNYSLVEKSFHPYYQGTFSQLIGRWNLTINAGFDQVRRYNYFGPGNESKVQQADIEFYRLRLKDLYGGFGLDQTFNNRHHVRLDFFYDAVKVIDNEEGFSSKTLGFIDPAMFHWKQFGGSQFSYTYMHTNDRVLPTSGVNFKVTGSYTQNLKESEGNVSKVSSSLNLYMPLWHPFSLALKTGAATLWGRPEFYQYNTLGGFYTLRGFWRFRFYGRSVFYNQTELRWLPTVKGHFYSGRVGLLAYFDQGRVWQPGENSTQWHYGYGAGATIVPFNKIAITATYSISAEGCRTDIRLGKLF